MSSNNKSNFGLILAVLGAALILGISIIYANNDQPNDSSQIIERGGEQFVVEAEKPITLTVVSDKECDKCETQKLETWLRTQLSGSPVALRRLDYTSKEGKAILAEYSGTYLPFLLLGSEVEQSSNFEHLTHHVISKVKDRYLVDLKKIGAPIGRYLNIASYRSDDPSAPKVVALKTEENMGEVKLSRGVAQTEFAIKNEGINPLVFLGMNTSCGCTSAKLITAGGESPIYQMAGHGEPVEWRGELAPGEEGKIVIFYDPSVHPDLEGDVMREIYLETNDPNNPTVTFKIFVKQSSN